MTSHPQLDGDATRRALLDKANTPRMFTTIARRYDFLNHALSLNIDRRWRRELIRACEVAPRELVLDVATGTADVALELVRRTRAASIVGLDPSSGMLEVARGKIARDAGANERVRLLEGDALALPFADASFDVVTIAFGLRNLPDYDLGVREMVRVLRPGGRLVVLEFLPPAGVARLVFRSYVTTVLPVVGRAISGSREAYSYLAASIGSFIPAADVRRLLEDAGMQSVSTRRLTGGIAGLHRGVKRS